MPWYIALTGSIIIIILGIYKKLNIGLTMLIGAVSLGLLSSLTAEDFFRVFINGLWNDITIMLVISILLLGVLGHILKETGTLEEIINNLHSLVADIRVIAVAMPALIGMLTVPGGAVLSAPLCVEAGTQLKMPAERQAVINIWFRHVFYFILPIFPSLILASQLSEINIGRYVLHNLPLTTVGVVFGFFFLFRNYSTGTRGLSISWEKTWQLIRSIMPLLFVMVLVVFFNIYFPLALTAGIILALANYLPSQKRFNVFLSRVKTMIIPGIKIPVAFVIIGIMVYKEMLESTAVIIDLTNLVLDKGVPVIILLTFIPFLVGMLTGDNSASVAILFPMFMPLIPTGAAAYAAYLAYLYASSTSGHIVSPAHPCFSLTKEYCKGDIKKIVLLTLPLLAVVMLTGFLITLLFGFH
ncbi:MAG: DUF401 family protein [Bacillota bacterium]|nr:DUF401 family protein [Bacillota bacterium]